MWKNVAQGIAAGLLIGVFVGFVRDFTTTEWLALFPMEALGGALAGWVWYVTEPRKRGRTQAGAPGTPPQPRTTRWHGPRSIRHWAVLLGAPPLIGLVVAGVLSDNLVLFSILGVLLAAATALSCILGFVTNRERAEDLGLRW